jgi:hypothetical protein
VIILDDYIDEIILERPKPKEEKPKEEKPPQEEKPEEKKEEKKPSIWERILSVFKSGSALFV